MKSSFPSSIETISGNDMSQESQNPSGANDLSGNKTPTTGIRGGNTNIRVKKFARAILRLEETDPEAFHAKLTSAIQKRRAERANSTKEQESQESEENET